MYRTLILSLALAAPALAQRAGEEPLPDPPRLALRQPVLPAARVTSLATEPRYLSPRVDAGIVYPRPPEEAMIDMEAVLRSYLPDEESLQRNEERLQPTLQRMQGLWRVEKMTLDGVEIPPAAFAGTKYLVQGRVLAQSETSESWERVWPTPPVRVQPPTPPAGPPVEPGSAPKIVNGPGPVDVMPLGPAAVTRPAGTTPRLDPRQEEEIRMNMVYQGEGRARVFWWNRYGESADPHLSRDRPSLRVALPVRGNLQVADTTMTLEVRGFGLRTLLPSKFHTPFNPLGPDGREELTTLEPDRRVSLVLVRDETVAEPLRETRPNIIPSGRRVRYEWEP
jgi:hypothetical protein